MKHLLIASSLLVSGAYAADNIDYYECQQPLLMEGLNITPEGKISTPFGFQSAPDVESEKSGEDGSISETLTFKSHMRALNGKPLEKVVKVKRDKNGSILSVSTSQDKMDAQQIQNYKQMALQNAVYSGLNGDSLTYDPMVQVNDGVAGQGLSFGKVVPLSKLTKKQAQQFGVDIDHLRKLRRETKKDKKALKKIHEGYSQLLDKSHMMLPNGATVDFKIEHGACKVQSVQKGLFDTKDKKNVAGQKLDAERCEKVNKISGKYKVQMMSCAQTHSQLSQELWALDGIAMAGGGMVGGSVGGASTKAAPQLGAQGGIASGQGSGAGIGMGGGFNSYPGGFMMGSQEVFDCQSYFPAQDIYGYPGAQGGNQGFGIGVGSGIGF